MPGSTILDIAQQEQDWMLADSFYEWKKAGKQRIPYRIVLKSGEPFAFAGIWEENMGDDGHPLKTSLSSPPGQTHLSAWCTTGCR